MRDEAVQKLKLALVQRNWDDKTLGDVVDTLIAAAIDRVGAGDQGTTLREALKSDLADEISEMRALVEKVNTGVGDVDAMRVQLQGLVDSATAAVSEVSVMRDELRVLVAAKAAESGGADDPPATSGDVKSGGGGGSARRSSPTK